VRPHQHQRTLKITFGSHAANEYSGTAGTRGQ